MNNIAYLRTLFKSRYFGSLSKHAIFGSVLRFLAALSRSRNLVVCLSVCLCVCWCVCWLVGRSNTFVKKCLLPTYLLYLLLTYLPTTYLLTYYLPIHLLLTNLLTTYLLLTYYSPTTYLLTYYLPTT